jgi:hypothetical protein
MDRMQHFAIFLQDTKPPRSIRSVRWLIDASSKLFLNNGTYVFIYSWRNREVMLHPCSMGDNGEIDRWKEISSEATSLTLTPGEA